MKFRVVLLGFLVMATMCSATPVTIIFQAFHGPGWQAGYPYFAEIKGITAVPVMCNDYAHGGEPGDTWQANFTDLGTINSGNIGSSLLRFNQLPSALTLYQEAGYLLLLTNVVSSSEFTDVNIAVWYLFDRSTPLTFGAKFFLLSAYTAARQGFPGVDFSEVSIFTPVNQHDPNLNDPQELMTLDSAFHPVPSAPEPGTVALLASGVICILGRIKILESQFRAGYRASRGQQRVR